MKREYTLVGVNGNAFAIMGYVVRAMKLEHKSKDEIDAYIRKCEILGLYTFDGRVSGYVRGIK